MLPLRQCLERARHELPELRDLADAVGMEPSRPPPTEATLRRLRELVGAALDLSPSESEAHHPASCWRFHIAQE
eukprot:9102957-Heterocapsa_arctica.AAC.1